ncbi:MAG: phosphate ABC transporter permease subunit PstC, partial [Terriglobales bacterium]
MANRALPRPRFEAPEPERGAKATLKLETTTAPLLQGKVSEIPDALFGGAMRFCGLAVVALLGLIVYQLILGSELSWHAFGWKFFGQTDWNPVEDQYGALPFIYGTVVSSLLSLVIAVPLAVGVAVFITEMCPVRLRGALSFTTELLAAIPSVVYGLWAIFVLVPVLRLYVQPFLAKTLGWTTLFSGPPYGVGMLAAGVILAIMIIPIISSITREVLSVVPQHQREAVLA